MKRIIIPLVIILAFTACGSGKRPPTKKKSNVPAKVRPWFKNHPNSLFEFQVKQAINGHVIGPNRMRLSFPAKIKEDIYTGVHERIANLHQSHQTDVKFDEHLNETVEFTIKDKKHFKRDFSFPGYRILGANTRILSVTKLANTMNYNIKFVDVKKTDIIQKFQVYEREKGFSGEFKIGKAVVTFNKREPEKVGLVYMIRPKKKRKP
jgi:hypothetical protein